jgi:hypothetical protein
MNLRFTPITLDKIAAYQANVDLSSNNSAVSQPSGLYLARIPLVNPQGHRGNR